MSRCDLYFKECEASCLDCLEKGILLWDEWASTFEMYRYDHADIWYKISWIMLIRVKYKSKNNDTHFWYHDLHLVAITYTMPESQYHFEESEFNQVLCCCFPCELRKLLMKVLLVALAFNVNSVSACGHEHVVGHVLVGDIKCPWCIYVCLRITSISNLQNSLKNLLSKSLYIAKFST